MKEGTALAEQFQASYDALSSEAQALYDQERQAALAAEAQAAIEQIQQESEPESSNNNGASRAWRARSAAATFRRNGPGAPPSAPRTSPTPASAPR